MPLKYMVSGGLVFWGAFAAALLFGVLTVWTARGRIVLRSQASFLRSLWVETMRRRDSIPARWSCRLSGTALRVSPRLAAMIYHHPEVPFIYAPLFGLVVLVSASVFLLRGF